MVLARMIQAAELETGERVLDVACGTGYSSAILARLSASVTALEDDADRSRRCGEILAQLTPLGTGNVAAVVRPARGRLAGRRALRRDPGQRRLRDRAAGADSASSTRADAWSPSWAPVRIGKATLFRKDHGEIGSRPLFDAAAPALPAFAKAPAFVF